MLENESFLILTSHIINCQPTKETMEGNIYLPKSKFLMTIVGA